MSQLKYRSDIDGLRAVAVLGVVIYHAFPWVIPGGFIGVDIFFVISGYLISGILYKGHKEGNFSFKEFYARRVRRLFPALITVLLVTMAYGWLILLPDEFQQLGKHVAAGTLFIQNIVFWQESGYFDTAANLKPLLHLWSLAVEEQFYIFFPPILLLIWKRKWPLAAMMGVLLLASMIGNLVMSYQNSASDFFLTPYRAWEFLGGSLLAWWHYDRGHEGEVPPYREALSIGGILLVLAMGLIHKETPYPGWRALLPVAGTLMLMEGGREAWVNRKILSNPAVVWIGLISYPLYLFHWPALSFVHIVKGESPKPGYIVAALGVSLLLTILTYYMVEVPVRFSKSKIATWALLLGFTTVGIFGWIIWRKGIYSAADKRSSQFASALNEKGYFKDWNYGSKKDSVWTYKTGSKNPKVLYVGDSNMWQYAPRIAIVANENKIGVEMIGWHLVPPIKNISNNEKPQIENVIKYSLQALSKEKNITRVVLTAWWDGYFSNGSKYKCNGFSLDTKEGRLNALKNLEETINEFKHYGKEVIILLSIPNGIEFDPKTLFLRSFIGAKINPSPKVSVVEYLNKKDKIDLRSDLIKVAQCTGVKVIDPSEYMQSNGFFIIEDDKGPIRIDDHHLRPSYVRDSLFFIDETVSQ